MIHNLHILLGDSAGQNVSRIKEYAIKYGSDYKDSDGNIASDYLQLMLYTDDGKFLLAQKKEQDNSKFVSGIEDQYAVELVESPIKIGDNSQDSLVGFFRKLFSSTVNLERPGDGALHTTIHIPLYHKWAWERAKTLMAAMTKANTTAEYSVDLVLFSADLVYVLESGSEIDDKKYDEYTTTAKQLLPEVVAAKTSGDNDILQNIILIQNHNEGRVALDLNEETYTNVLGEYALSTTVSYNTIFSPAFKISTSQNYPVLGLGMSMLHFDRFHFVQYMLRKAYDHILKREGINQDTVNINTITKLVQKVLGPNVDIFSKIYDNLIKPRLDVGMAHDDIVAEIQPEVDAAMNGIEEVLIKHLSDSNLSLPEKRVILAQLLGEDDEMMRGELFNPDQLTISDCQREVLDLFVTANNKLALHKDKAIVEANKQAAEDEPKREENPLKTYAVLSDFSSQPVESAESRIQRIKALKLDIRTSTNYVRTQTGILEKLTDSAQKEELVHKRLTKDGFEFDNQVYRLLPKVDVKPLEETFEYGGEPLPPSVDLREHFTCVKNQGSLGSCASHTIVGIYEQILKKNTHNDLNLSELFAYHNARNNARKRRGVEPEGEGTSFYDNIMGMMEFGICLEYLHAYETQDVKEPSEEAFADAATRKISKALNVKCELDHIKAAVAKGYPVAIALHIFDSFVTQTGFVPRPTDEEIANIEGGGHGMIVCGYSDADKVFIVRNSWGERFGDKGYCYIPYSYMGDPQLLIDACIITEISQGEIKVGGLVNNTAVSFNKSDAKVHAAMIRTLIDEQLQYQKKLEAELALLRNEYIGLYTNLGVPENRGQLQTGTKLRLTAEISEKELQEKRTIEERTQDSNDWKRDNTKIAGWCGGVVLVVILIHALLWRWLGDFAIGNYLKSAVAIWNDVQLLAILGFFASPWIIKRTRHYINNSDDIENFANGQRTFWLVWGCGLGVLAIVYAFCILFGCLPELLTRPIFISLLAFGFTLIPFVWALSSRRLVYSKMIKEYERIIAKIATERAELQKELDLTPMKMFVAGQLLDSITLLITNLTNRYYGIKSYVKNLRQWYDENRQENIAVPINRQPFMSLANTDCFDSYFEANANTITDGLRLHELFTEGVYQLTDEQIIAFKNLLKSRLQQVLMGHVANFSICNYVTETATYQYVDKQYVNVDKLLTTMDKNSLIFVQTRGRIADSSSQNVRLKMLFREPANAQLWDSKVQINFAIPPTPYNVNSQYKLFIIRLEGLNLEEIAMLVE